MDLNFEYPDQTSSMKSHVSLPQFNAIISGILRLLGVVQVVRYDVLVMERVFFNSQEHIQGLPPTELHSVTEIEATEVYTVLT